jgi:hypothetical protein
MYRTCIFCSADLGGNQALEAFPVGRSVAFDAARGRLWAICGRCCRWNLAPLEERWEAVEAAERGFRGSRLRVQSENIGLCRLPDGTRLVRVGDALAGELAAWRYGGELKRRRRRSLLGRSAAGVVRASLWAGALAFAPGLLHVDRLGIAGWNAYRGRRPIHRVAAPGGEGTLPVQLRQALRARLELSGAEIELHLPEIPARRWAAAVPPLVIRGREAQGVMGRVMVAINARGARAVEVQDALGTLQAAGSAREFLVGAAGGRRMLHGGVHHDVDAHGFATVHAATGYSFRVKPPMTPDPPVALALEMAIHEETERRALEGDLAGLEEMWRQAEQIAAIADALPGAASPSSPAPGIRSLAGG